MSYRELRDMWRTNQLVNPRTGRRIVHGGPTYNALLAEFGLVGADSSPERDDLLRRYALDCTDMSDPVSLIEFSDMSIDELRNLVQIGTGSKKNCFGLDTIYRWITTNPTATNPMTNELIPPQQVQAITAAYNRMYVRSAPDMGRREDMRRDNLRREAARIVRTNRWDDRNASPTIDALRNTSQADLDEFFQDPNDLHRFVWAHLHGVNM